MAEYTGGRIVPTHGGVWNKTRKYEELTIVLNEATGDSYISKRPVPAGTEIYEEHYWVLYSQYNEQITRAEDHLDDTARAIRAEMTAQAQQVNKRMALAEENVDDRATAAEELADTRATEAENLSNQNKTALEARMNTIEARQDANVRASTDASADYAAEVVDARVSGSDTVYPSLNAHIQAIEDGTEISKVKASAVKGLNVSIARLWENADRTFKERFDYSYDDETDSLTLICKESNSADMILYASMISPKEYAELYRTDRQLYVCFNTKNVVTERGTFKLGVWLCKCNDPDLPRFQGIVGSLLHHTFPEGDAEIEDLVAVRKPSLALTYDEETHCYTRDGIPVSILTLIVANSANEGEQMTVSGLGNIFPGMGNTQATDSLMQNMLYGEHLELQKKVDRFVGTVNEKLDTTIASIRDSDYYDYDILPFVNPGKFAFSDSIGEEVTDEYGDQTWTVEYVNNAPMYFISLTDIAQEDVDEVIVEVTARTLVPGAQLRTQVFNLSCGYDHSAGDYLHRLTSDYRKYQFRQRRIGSGNTVVGIGPNPVVGNKIQFKDARVFIPHEMKKQIPVRLKEFHGYLGDVDFTKMESENIEDSIMIGTDDYARQDGLYLESVDVFFAESNWQRAFYVGCIDQYGLFQEVSSFMLGGARGANHIKTERLQIKVPAGYGIFMKTNKNMPLFRSDYTYGFKNLVSRESVVIDENGYSGNPLCETEWMVPFRYTLTEKPLGMRLDEMEEGIESRKNEISAIDSRVTVLETGDSDGKIDILPIYDPAGVKYHITVDENGQLHPIRSIPNKVLCIGNSLLFGFGEFGMAATDINHDYFHYLKVFLEGKNPEVTFTKAYGSTWEACTTSADRQDWIDATLENSTDGTEDLITIQLSDNVNTAEKRATFPQDMYTMLSAFRRHCPNARIIWIASWYGYGTNYQYVKAACDDLHIDLLDITDLAGVKENQNVIGGKYYRDGKEMEITSAGVASHPGDLGMQRIADRLIALLEKYM